MTRNRQSTIDNRPLRASALVRGGIQRGFTLVEMLVVIAIIALLLAALLPAFGVVKNRAKITQCNAQLKAVEAGLSMFRAEASLGGALPPSSSDEKVGNTAHGQLIADPAGEDANPTVRVAGAHLLVHALMGADGLGTPGFRDIDQNGKWSNDTHKKLDNDLKKSGAYAIETAGEKAGKEKFSRYPGGGGGYVDDKMRESAHSLQYLVDKGIVVDDQVLDRDNVAKGESMFLDAWDHPILYYRANPSALTMVGKSGQPGIYWQEDNSIITGSDKGLYNHDGWDFGQGKENEHLHNLRVAEWVEPTLEDFVNKIPTDERFNQSFARFILDPSVKARPTPVNKDSYLLISAGPDSRYGTEDDVTNWTRKTD